MSKKYNLLMYAIGVSTSFFVILVLLLLINLSDVIVVVNTMVYQFVLFIVSLGIGLMGLNIYVLLLYRREIIDVFRRKEENVREYYLYNERFEPPVTDT